VKEKLPQLDQNMVVLVVGGFAGSSSWFFTYPLDVIKTKIQVDFKTNFLYEFKKLKTV
jgi:hypothetical protein